MQFVYFIIIIWIINCLFRLLIVELETVLVVLLIVKSSLQCAAETNKKLTWVTHMGDRVILEPRVVQPSKVHCLNQWITASPLLTSKNGNSVRHTTKVLTFSPFRIHKLNQLRTLVSLSSNKPETNATMPLTSTTDEDLVAWRSWRRLTAIARHGSLQCDTCVNAEKFTLI